MFVTTVKKTHEAKRFVLKTDFRKFIFTEYVNRWNEKQYNYKIYGNKISSYI